MQRSVLLQLLGLPRDESENINNSDLYDITIDWYAVSDVLELDMFYQNDSFQYRH